MKYRAFIEQNFLIDEPTTGQLVPFKFNKVQVMYYEMLIALGLEERGLDLPLRELIVKARREGFSSLILALFAADDILQSNPTETQVVSYKDDATAVFRKRYRRFVLCCHAREAGVSVEQIQKDPNVLEAYSKQVFSVDAADLELKHNRAHFYCGTAAARTGGRGGVLQKLLFSEAAHYQDTEKMTSREVIDGTMRQVDLSSGWVFQESTANGIGNYFFQTYEAVTKGLSRFALRFFGWRSFYTEEQFKTIASEFTDIDMLKQEYPETIEEAFRASNLSFTNKDKLLALVGLENVDKTFEMTLDFSGTNYIDQCESIKDFAISFEKTHPNRNIYLGLDSAKSVDRSVLTILMGKDLSSQGGIKGICIDSTGQGDFIPDWFERNTKWYILRFKFSRPSKSVMYKNLQVIIEDHRTSLPEIMMPQVALAPAEFVSDEMESFFRQMTGLQKEIIGNMLVVAHPKGSCKEGNHDYKNCPYHDDYPDSWALSEWLYVSLNGLPLGQRPPEEKGNFNSAIRRLLGDKNRNNTGVDDYN